ncbi:hypothetical protein A4H97_32845 [Niastella yeongjuensis]|uniref:Uncharacterized protein n=1 Tax=Niastella yeongjuensis TaxID=354355 RepID=A0A1V9EG66_9BACT|nr:hypothetical protein [Niastella yeongjuensis]OQP45129.1 hypothetical protein A4H97_32845 [Niastella yeongjuensis]SEP48669.1 hypothetical protein SAMN05660816_06806 [Niastella yeongjuensis]
MSQRKHVIFLLMLLGALRGYSQDSLIEAIEKDFHNSEHISYNKLPGFIKSYVALREGSSGVANKLFNASNAGHNAIYIRRSGTNYNLTYSHREKSHHYHSIILMTDGKAIINANHLVVSRRATVNEFSNFQIYRDTVLPIVEAFSESGIRIRSYKTLPRFVRTYLNQKNDSKFTISKTFFSVGDAGPFLWPHRKLGYIYKYGDYYLLSYKHGGIGLHFHSIIFKTDGKKVMNMYNLTISPHSTIADLIRYIEDGWFHVQDFDEV